VAQAFIANVLKLNGMPTTIVSDRDPAFNNSFWCELFQLQGISLAFSFAYHPQSDGQTEALKKCVQTYLRCYTASNQRSGPLGYLWTNGGITLTTIPQLA
jgi:hypothetical protein